MRAAHTPAPRHSRCWPQALSLSPLDLCQTFREGYEDLGMISERKKRASLGSQEGVVPLITVTEGFYDRGLLWLSPCAPPQFWTASATTAGGRGIKARTREVWPQLE